MATTDVEKLVVQMSADLKQFEKAFANASGVSVRELRKVERQAQTSVAKIEGTLGKVGVGLKSFAAGFLGGLGIEAIARIVAGAVSSVAQLADEAKRAGVSAEDLQLLAVAAHQVGVSAEDTTNLLQKLNKTIGEAVTKGGDFAKLLAANGVALRDQNGEVRSTKDLFFDVVDLISRAKSEQEAAAIAYTAFTRAAADSIPFLRQGSEEIKKGTEAAREAGGAISNELVAKADEFDDRWAFAWDTWSAKAKSALLEVLNSMDEVKGGDLAALEQKAREIAEQNKGNEQLQRRLELEEKIATALKTSTGLPLLVAWREELEAINRELAVAGPAFEKLGRGAQSTTVLPSLSRNAFDTGRGVVFPSKPDPAIEAAKKKAAAEAERLRKQAAAIAEREAEKIADVIDELRFEQQQLQASALTQEINNQLRQAGVSAMSAQGKEITALVTKNFELAQSEELTLEATEKWKESQEALKESMISLAQLGLDAFDSWIEGGQELSDILEDVAKQLAKAAVQAALFGQGPLAGLFGTSAGGGVFGNLFHTGGKVGQGGLQRRVNPMVFAGARSYHGGGLAGDEVAGILKKGEIVLPRGVSPGGSGFGKVIVNNFGGEVEQKESRGAGGERVLEFEFNARFDKRMASPNTQKFLGAGFGVRPSLTRR